MLTRKSMQKRKEAGGSERELAWNRSDRNSAVRTRPMELMGPIELMEPSSRPASSLPLDLFLQIE